MDKLFQIVIWSSVKAKASSVFFLSRYFIFSHFWGETQELHWLFSREDDINFMIYEFYGLQTEFSTLV